MKLNRTLTFIAIAYLIINGLFYWHATTLQGGMSMIYIFIYPVFWLTTLVIVLILSIRKRKTWFKKDMLLSTIVALIFCTPISVSGINLAIRPASYISSTGYHPENGYIKKDERWNYYTGGRAAEKYWKKRDDGLSYGNDVNFEKDSTWIYFNKKGDTIKKETYNHDKLIKVKQFK